MPADHFGPGNGGASSSHNGHGAQRGAEISFTSNAAQRQRQAAMQQIPPSISPPPTTMSSGSESPISDDDAAERMPLNATAVTSRGPSSGTNAGLSARGAASPGFGSPSGFGLSSSLHSYPAPSSPILGSQKREKMKGHPVLRLNHLVTDHPYLFVVIGLLILASCFWLAFMPHHPGVHPAAATTATIDDMPTIIRAADALPPVTVAPAAAAPAEIAASTPTTAPATVAPTPKVEAPQPAEPIKTPEPVAAAPAQPEPAAVPVATPTPVSEPVKQPEAAPLPPTLTPAAVATDEPRPAVSTPPSSNSAADAALSENDDRLSRADLNDAALHCAAPSTQKCDWSWGQWTRSPNSEDHPREDLSPDSSWKKPQDFYSFQAGLHVSGEGTGVVVRIHMKDLCCTGPLPLSYFRITAHGAAQAASNPPLALGPRPAALERGHQPVHLARRGWGRNIDLSSSPVDEERVLQTFLLLPDPGVYAIQVVLLHYNSSIDMISENYNMNSKLYAERPGQWVNGLLKNARGETTTKLSIPEATSFTHANRAEMPICGGEGAGKLGGFSAHGTKYGMPLAGRWLLKPPQEADPAVGYVPVSAAAATGEVDYTALPKRWLAEHSVYTPYFCRLEVSAPDLIPRALEKVQWMHFTGDSNTRHMFYFVCEMGNGTLQHVNGERVPRYLDPPHSCIGPSSPDNRPDSETGLTVGASPRWVLTYTNWFWGKQQTLTQPETPGTDFEFRTQCSRYVEQNRTGLFYGWPNCNLAPEHIQSLPGPGLTYFGWGSHAAEMGRNPLTGSYFLTEEAFGMPYFRHHPVIFPLTTANTPQLIPDKFGPQQRMRNNERVHASNTHLVEAVMHHRLNYATRTEGGSAAPANWIPLFDLFSPTHAAYEVLAVDAVHFDKFFSYEEPKWLAHYILNAPNFGPRTRKNSGAAPADAATV